MSYVTDELDKIDDIKGQIYQAISDKGVTIPANTPFEDYPNKISSIPIEQPVIPKEVNGSYYGNPTQYFTFELPENAIDLDDYVLYDAFIDNNHLTSADLSSLINISGSNAMSGAFQKCTSLASIDLSNLQTITGDLALSLAFGYCTSLTTVNLSKLTTVGYRGLGNTFLGCTNITSVDISNLTSIGDSGLNSFVYGCTKLTSVNVSNITSIGSLGLTDFASGCTSLRTITFPKLTYLSNQSLQNAFKNCNNLTIYFPSLTTSSFGSYTNQFNAMLQNASNCVVHFPASIKSTIQNWTSVKNNFGGTGISILYDL